MIKRICTKKKKHDRTENILPTILCAAHTVKGPRSDGDDFLPL